MLLIKKQHLFITVVTAFSFIGLGCSGPTQRHDLNIPPPPAMMSAPTSTNDPEAIKSISRYSFKARAILKTETVKQRFYLNGLVDNGLFFDVSGPFNSHRVRVVIHPDRSMYLLMDEQGVYKAESEAALTEGVFRTPVPLSALPLWIKGLLSANASHKTYDKDNQLISFMDNGMSVSLANYRDLSGYEMPGKLIVQNDSLKLVLVMSAFEVLPSERDR